MELIPIDKMSDNQIVDACKELLASGDLHVSAETYILALMKRKMLLISNAGGDNANE